MDVTTARPLALTGSLPAWDIERRRVNPTEVIAWTLDRIRQLGHPAVDLDTLHHHLDAAEALALAQSLTEASLAAALRRLVHRAVRRAIPEIDAERVWIQTHTHFRILVPHGTAAVVPPHTDYGFGHGLSERNVWLSLTDAEESAALHVLPLRESLSWQARTGKLHGVLEGAPEIPPVPTRAGDVLLFTPLHLHRAKPPGGDRCRVSVDIRLVPRPGSARDLTFSPLEREA